MPTRIGNRSKPNSGWPGAWPVVTCQVGARAVLAGPEEYEFLMAMREARGYGKGLSIVESASRRGPPLSQGPSHVPGLRALVTTSTASLPQ